VDVAMTRKEISGSSLSRRRVPPVAALEVARSVVWLSGEHDISTVGLLSQVLTQAVELNRPHVVVDMSGVRFMDASTVGVLVGTRNLLQAQGRSLLVRSPSSCARRLLELCELLDLLESGSACRRSSVSDLVLTNRVAI
jgi:anti-anti-sigma factor